MCAISITAIVISENTDVKDAREISLMVRRV